MTTLFLPFMNFFILLGIIGYFMRAPLRDFVSLRSTTLRDELFRVREQLQKAQERYDEFSSKLKAIDAEIAAIKDQAARDAQDMRRAVVDEAKRLAAVIAADARTAAEGLYGELRGKLYAELGIRVLERAEIILRDRLTGDDRARIRMEFSRQVESIQ